MGVFPRVTDDFCCPLGSRSWDWELTVQNLPVLWEVFREVQNCL